MSLLRLSKKKLRPFRKVSNRKRKLAGRWKTERENIWERKGEHDSFPESKSLLPALILETRQRAVKYKTHCHGKSKGRGVSSHATPPALDTF